MAAGPGIDVSGWLEAGLSGTPSLSQVRALALLGLLSHRIVGSTSHARCQGAAKNLVDPP
jgi:hypothetical protein